ncbi:MAG: hypothetical protein EB038_06345, partial [Cyclobacteriaceae bacterium]|nr:hypothetical protein [Cyclobacteriaceae bacterium]
QDAFEVRSMVVRPCEQGLPGDCIKVDVTLLLDAPIDIVWEVITDYQQAAQFITNLRSSTAKQLGPNKLQVEQVGRVGWNALNVDIKTVYHVHLNPVDKKIQSLAVAGDLKMVSMRTQLHSQANGGTLLEYTLTTDPGRWAPLLIAEELLVRNAKQSFSDLKREIPAASSKIIRLSSGFE